MEDYEKFLLGNQREPGFLVEGIIAYRDKECREFYEVFMSIIKKQLNGKDDHERTYFLASNMIKNLILKSADRRALCGVPDLIAYTLCRFKAEEGYDLSGELVGLIQSLPREYIESLSLDDAIRLLKTCFHQLEDFIPIDLGRDILPHAYRSFMQNLMAFFIPSLSTDKLYFAKELIEEIKSWQNIIPEKKSISTQTEETQIEKHKFKDKFPNAIDRSSKSTQIELCMNSETWNVTK